MSLLHSRAGDSSLRRTPGATRADRRHVGARMAGLCVRRHEHIDRRIIRPLRGLHKARSAVQLCYSRAFRYIRPWPVYSIATSATRLCCCHVCGR